jgi:DNA replication protein DnaC
MTLPELDAALRKLRLSDMADVLEASVEGTRKALMLELTTVPLLIIDDLGMRKLPYTSAEDLLEVIMRRYERASTLLTSNRPVDDWRKLLGDTADVTALLDRLLHHDHVLTCGPRSWRTRVHTDLRPEAGVPRCRGMLRAAGPA